MKKNILYFAVLIALSMMLCLLPACGTGTPSNNDGDDTTAAPTETEPPAPPLVLASGGVSEYAIVRPEAASQTVIDATVELYQAFTAAGIKITITTDWEKKGTDPATRPTKEILIGATNREETAQVKAELLYDDYAAKTVNEKVVICGGSDEATFAAGRKFVETYLSRGETVTDLQVERGPLFSQSATYPLTKLTIDGHEIREFTIAYTDKAYLEAAETLQMGIVVACGRVLPIASLSDVDGQKIIVGMPDSTAAIAPCTGDKVLNLTEGSFDHAIEQKGGTLVLAGASAWTAGDAVNAFVADYLTGKTGEVDIGEISLAGEMSASMPLYKDASLRIMTYNLLGTGENYTERYPYVIATIRRYLPDILGLQEAPKTVHSQIIDKISDVYAEAQKWHEGGTIVNYTPILYRKDKYKVIEAGVVFLRSRYTETNTKSMSWAVLETIETGERFIVTNLHGALIMATYNIPGSNSVEGAAWRVDNVAQMLEKLDELKAKYGDLPTLSTGDYNFNADAQAYKDAIAGGLRDAETVATVSRVTGIKTTHTVGASPVAGKSIDHIFVNDKVDVYVHNTVLEQEALKGSDHCAVYADVKLK